MLASKFVGEGIGKNWRIIGEEERSRKHRQAR